MIASNNFRYSSKPKVATMIFTYKHRVSGDLNAIRARSLNEARRQVTREDWKLVNCTDLQGVILWEASKLNMDF